MCNVLNPVVVVEKGQVFSCGANQMGQLGIGTNIPHVASPQRLAYRYVAALEVILSILSIR